MPVDRRFARRQALLSCAIMRNVAFYRVGYQTKDGRGRLKDDSQMGRTINSNFVDWEARHHWRRLVQGTEARTAFLTALFATLGLDRAGWDQYLTDMKTYRDRFVAHLDDDDTMHIPDLDTVLASTAVFYRHLVARAPVGTFVGHLPRDLPAYYETCRAEAATYHATYSAQAAPRASLSRSRKRRDDGSRPMGRASCFWCSCGTDCDKTSARSR
ncbi:hypothetical protein ABH944_008407 [Caballeronia udeis]|uniref:Uncharacterized protein n=1 Tax=Caballeronia udeis TaxID=1232866 RepID=A0ABW8MYE4_9BURK